MSAEVNTDAGAIDKGGAAQEVEEQMNIGSPGFGPRTRCFANLMEAAVATRRSVSGARRTGKVAKWQQQDVRRPGG
ncbi:uncharacterized protein MEPE_01031 [Melanopsichium pennsylvanicum]|uniref:Uncharacterized protein n=1 Tax=Melanopsichium pennsylvanicum TaxID=63383 RepID=A0AAJ4XH12_9BASI|nr:uncharacterized protein MEPE_01031 [Melanopsichium pennsylvanicum]